MRQRENRAKKFGDRAQPLETRIRKLEEELARERARKARPVISAVVHFLALRGSRKTSLLSVGRSHLKIIARSLIPWRCNLLIHPQHGVIIGLDRTLNQRAL
jgi:hypothetical protein